MSNNSDALRGITVTGRGTGSVPATGYTGASGLVTAWVDTYDLQGPVVFRCEVEGNSDLDGTFSLQHSASNAAQAANAAGLVTVLAADLTGGGTWNGNSVVNNTGGADLTAGTDFSAALGYIGDQRYVRGHLNLTNGNSGAVAAEVSLVGLSCPNVTPSR